MPVTDDQINEADEQFFIVQLILVEATNKDQIQIGRSFSECVIIDNDRELPVLIMHND